MKHLGFILFEGVSSYNGDNIVVIINGFKKSANRKTGAMLQTYILNRDMHPVEALMTGKDESVCGNCIHRPILAKETGEAVCYVNVHKGVASVYNAYKRGRYAHANVDDIKHLIKGRKVRFGTYGDPCVAPVEIFQSLASHASGHTGYTHRWGDKGFNVESWSPLVMASVDNVIESNIAKDMGMRYFRVSIGVDRKKGEISCPASKEMNKRTTCVNCILCSGTTSKGKNIVIADHGKGWKKRLDRAMNAK